MRRLKACITWSVLSLFAVTMLYGEGLHGLFGLQHPCAFSNHCCEFDHGGHASRDAAGHLSLCEADQKCELIGEADCPICFFFAQAHCLPVLSPIHSESLAVVENVAVTHCLDIGDRVLVYRSRAPPALVC
jgi:hypothetical protein